MSAITKAPVYKARYDKSSIGNMIHSGYTQVGMLVGMTKVAMTMGGAAGTTLTLGGVIGSVFSVGIPFFMLGTAIREGRDKEAENRNNARMIILAAGLAEAVEIHRRSYPRSKLLDADRPTGIAVLSDGRYYPIAMLMKGMYYSWWDQLGRDLDAWHGRSAHWLADVTGGKESWSQFVTTRFDRITREYGRILMAAERL